MNYAQHIHEALRARILQHVPGLRLYLVSAPKSAAFPYVVFHPITGTEEPSLNSGQTGEGNDLRDSVFQVDAFAAKPGAALTLRDSVLAAVQNSAWYIETSDNSFIDVQRVWHDGNEGCDAGTRDTGDGQGEVHRAHVDIRAAWCTLPENTFPLHFLVGPAGGYLLSPEGDFLTIRAPQFFCAPSGAFLTGPSGEILTAA